MLALLVLNGWFGLDSHASPRDSIVQYVASGDASQIGIDFLADGKSLFIGGCQPFDLVSRCVPSGCRYPVGIRWATVSPDGSLILAAALSGPVRCR